VIPPLQRYAELLLEWNRSVNLTGARTSEEVAAQIVDAGRLRAMAWDGIARVIDIGSGGGLPAVPLAIGLPTIEFTLLEANQRKCAFLEYVAGSLGLRNVTVAPGRAEDLGHNPTFREVFDRAISRAAARPGVLLELALPFVRTGGDLIAEVGPIDPSSLDKAARILGGGPPRLEGAPSEAGMLLTVAKVAPTPARYPRRPGVPNRRPLA
jgi:16S rRNA (guanine527-N7)-methyltransferase